LLPQRTVAGNLRSDSSVGTTREILVVGRRLNESLTVTFEQALGTAASALLVAYRLSDRLSVVAQTGSNNALNLVYSVAFD
jgi:translocation and assembly module TamB